MQVMLYTEKTVPQSLTAISERLHQKGTSSRLVMDGWIEKSGSFAVSVTTPVIGKFNRTTRLSGKLERQSGITVLHGTVPGGVDSHGRMIIIGALMIAAAALILSGNPLLGAILIPSALWIYIPLKGDYHNSAVLISEIQKNLKARATPPKPDGSKGRSKISAHRSTDTAKMHALLAESDDDTEDDEE